MWMLLLPILSAQARAPEEVVAGKDDVWLVKKLAKEDRTPMRAAIVAEMGALRSPDLLSHLLRATGDRAAEVRIAALSSLDAYGGDLADPERDAAFLAGLRDDNPGCVAAAEAGLADRIAARVQTGLDRVLGGLTELTRAGAGWQTRRAAVRLLAAAPADPEVDRALAEVATRDAHAEVRRSAVLALGARGASAASRELHRLKTSDPDEGVRLAAEEVLSRLGVAATDVVLAVMPFEGGSGAVEQLASGMQDYFTASLASSRVAIVVERKQVDAVLSELRFQDRNIDDGKAVQIGKLLRATQVVTGTVHSVGDEVTCAVKRIDVATGQVWAPLPVVGTLHDLTSVQRTCASRLAGTF